MLQHAHAPLQ
jgi:hypothetical protein